MKKDIDLQDLIKIVSDIQTRDRQKVTINSNDSNFKSPQNIQEIFANDEISLDEKLTQLKIYETMDSKKDLISSQNLFYEEAKLLENIELSDDYYNNYYSNQKILLPMESYIDYKKMSILELKRYLIWRTKVRRGIFDFCSSKFIYLYVNEIYREIGVKSAEEGFDLLIFLLDHLYQLNYRNLQIFKPVVFEYLFSHQFDLLKCNSYEKFKRLFITFSHPVLYQLWQEKYQENIEFIITNYYPTFKRSKFIRDKHLEKYKDIASKVIKELNLYLSKHHFTLKSAFFDRIEEKNVISLTRIFDINAQIPNTNQTIALGFNQKIVYNNHQWIFIKPVYHLRYQNFFQYVFHRIEYLLRKTEKYHLIKEINLPVMLFPKDQLEQVLYSKDIKNLIEMTITKELNFNELSLGKKVIIDLEKLDDIRKTSSEVSIKLLTEFDKEEEVVSIKEVMSKKEFNNPWQNLVTNLTNNQYAFLTNLFNDNSLSNLKMYCQNINMLLEVMVESINELALEVIDDNLLELMDDVVMIYPEYIENLKNNIKGGISND